MPPSLPPPLLSPRFQDWLPIKVGNFEGQHTNIRNIQEQQEQQEHRGQREQRERREGNDQDSRSGHVFTTGEKTTNSALAVVVTATAMLDGFEGVPPGGGGGGRGGGTPRSSSSSLLWSSSGADMSESYSKCITDTRSGADDDDAVMAGKVRMC